MRKWRYNSRILNLGIGWRWVTSFTLLMLYFLRKNSPLIIIQEPKWAPESVWKLWRRKYFVPTENRTPTPLFCPSLVLVATWTELREFE
jgi:hypothetical protein